MRLIVALLAFFGATLVTAAPGFNNNGISPAMRGVLIDMLKNLMTQTGFKFGGKPPQPPPLPFKPLPPNRPAFLPPTPPQPPRRPPPPIVRPNTNGGVFMDIPNSGAGGGRFGAPMMNFVYCPPGPTSSDSCKDQKLMEALYFPDGSPRYNWVPPRNPYDSSIPDTVKDTAENILRMKVNSRPNRTPTAKEWELMTILGDPKEHGPHSTNPFAG